MSRDSLSLEEAAHLLRRLCFGGSRDEQQALRGKSRLAAFDILWSKSQTTTASALPSPLDSHATLAQLREQWVAHMVWTPSSLRENLTLFFHALVGSSSNAVKNVPALGARNALLREASLTSVPGLFERLVTDPAMMVQVGMSGHGVDRVSDRPAKLVLEHWTVGAGAYGASEMEELSRSLTGWAVSDAGARFDPAQFDAGTKTLYGKTASFDARTAVAHVARQPATARRIGRRLLRHVGVVDPPGLLVQQLETTYAKTDGSIRALLEDIVASEAFWGKESRASLIKSPVHLVVGACREFGLGAPPAAPVDAWLTACGQTLFDTPNNGEGGWKDQEAWITPPDRLAIRYSLGDVLGGISPPLGFSSAPSSKRSGVRRVPERVRRTLASLSYQLA